jgi:hypothetical protein
MISLLITLPAGYQVWCFVPPLLWNFQQLIEPGGYQVAHAVALLKSHMPDLDTE